MSDNNFINNEDFYKVNKETNFTGLAFNDILNSYSLYLNWRDLSNNKSIPAFATRNDFLKRNSDYPLGINGIEFTIDKQLIDILELNGTLVSNDEIAFGLTNSDKLDISQNQDDSIANFIKLGVRIKKTVLSKTTEDDVIIGNLVEFIHKNDNDIGTKFDSISINENETYEIIKYRFIKGVTAISSEERWRIQQKKDNNDWTDLTSIIPSQNVMDISNISLAMCSDKQPDSNSQDVILKRLVLFKDIKGVAFKGYENGTPIYENVPIVKLSQG